LNNYYNKNEELFKVYNNVLLLYEPIQKKIKYYNNQNKRIKR